MPGQLDAAVLHTCNLGTDLFQQSTFAVDVRDSARANHPLLGQ